MPGATSKLDSPDGAPVLPRWERGTVAVLCVSGPHPIPVSTAVRAGDDRLVLALGADRDTLARLRSEPGAAVCVLAADLAFTAHGSARVIRERLAASERVAAVDLAVERVQDHLADGRTEMLAAARWRWRRRRDAESQEAIVAELERL